MPFVQKQPPFTAHLSIRPKAGSPARCFLTLSYRLCVSQLCKHQSLDLRHRQCKTRHFHFALPLRVLYLPHGFARTARSEFAVCGCRLDMNPAGRVPLKPHQTTVGMRGLEPVGRFLRQVRMREVNLWLHATAAAFPLHFGLFFCAPQLCAVTPNAAPLCGFKIQEPLRKS